MEGRGQKRNRMMERSDWDGRRGRGRHERRGSSGKIEASLPQPSNK